jgi:hypothetical protein
MSTGSGEAKRPDWIALAAVVLTIGVHIVIKLVSDKPSAVFIGGASIFWIVFAVVRARQDQTIFQQWGFRVENLLPTAAASAAIFCLSAAAMAAFAQQHGTLHFPPATLVLFAIYPIWGVVQQFLALGIVVGNLDRIDRSPTARIAIVTCTAALFASLHFYDLRLAAATFAFELIVIPLFMKYHNLWPIGILQGWLGALFYLWVLNEDLWSATFRQ